METIDDIRREQGNPRHAEVGGPPRSVTKFFSAESAPKFASFGLFVAAVILIGAGAASFIFPIAIAGFVVLAAAGLVQLRYRR